MAKLKVVWRNWRARRMVKHSGAFDKMWYLEQYRDVANSDEDPIQHYLSLGYLEGRSPSPLFDSRWYLREYLGGSDASVSPLVDYLRFGSRIGRKPNRWFDPRWYRKTYNDIPKEFDPLVNYVRNGAEKGHEPSREFPIHSMFKGNPALRERTNALSLYMSSYRLTACIGECTACYVSGWAARAVDPKQLIIAILVNGIEQGRIVPWIDRPDVEQVLGLRGMGFFFKFPTRLSSGDVVELRDEFAQSCDGYLGHELNYEGCYKTYEIPDLGTSSDLHASRASIAASFLVGSGIEIGAFTQPTDLPPDRQVVYFDRYSAADLRQYYDQDCHRPLMEPTYVGDAETLDELPDSSFNFLIANHVIEHLQDPIQFLKKVASKLTVGGRAMIAAPDKRYSFDKQRPLTSVKHIFKDHEGGPAQSKNDHLWEWAAMVQGLQGQAATDWIQAFDPDDMRIHYHVWDADSFIEFISAAVITYRLPLKLIHSASAANEVVVVLESFS